MSRLHSVIVAVLVATAGVTSAAQHVVGQQGRLFSPGKLTVKAGAVVSFLNDDNVTHHVYSSTKGYEFNIATMAPRQSGTHTFAKRGRVDVRCGLHPGMRLVVVVE